MLRRLFAVALVVCTVAVAPCFGQDTLQREADRLATLLKWHPGSVLAEIGAGNGKLTLAASQRAGPSGKVYTTEIDAKALAHLRELAAKERNVIAVKAAEADTNLPPECCDSIFMRLVYHHLTKPTDIDASLFRSLKPGGRLAVIDQNPRTGTSIPEGVPKNRGGHGVPQQILINELTAAGFEVETVDEDWPSRDELNQIYCVVFGKTKTNGAGAEPGSVEASVPSQLAAGLWPSRTTRDLTSLPFNVSDARLDTVFFGVRRRQPCPNTRMGE